MASSDVLHAHPTNGFAGDSDNSDVRGLEHEDTTSMGAVEPADRPEQDVSETGPEEAHTQRHEQLRSAQPEGTGTSPVLVNPPAAQPVAPSPKDKPTGSPTKRPAPTVHTTIGKAAVSGPPTPQVKKVLNSGRFGTGVTKAVPPPVSKTTVTSPITGKFSTNPQASSTLRPPAVSNPAAKKSPTSTSSPPSKVAMPPKLSAAPSRRTSQVPPKPAAPPARSSTLSASTSGKLSSATPSSTAAKPPSTALSRASVASPDSTVSAKSAATSRPRALVPESTGPKKAPAPRASLPPSTKLPTTTTARTSRTPAAGSISSLKEAKEDSAALVEIQNKLNEATISLGLKSSTISELETQVEELTASLVNTTADLEAARENLENAELAKAAAEKGFMETREALATSQADGDKLQQVLDELEAAKLTAADQNTLVETLREQIDRLQAEVDGTKEALEALRAAHADDEGIAATAEIDRQALVKARADLEAIKTETAALKAAHAEKLDAAAVRVSALELQASNAESLTAEIVSLRNERQETSSKLSELEVEILELNEARDLAEEERKTSEARINTLREDAQNAAEATDKAVQDAATKASAAAKHLEEVTKQHTEALALAVEESRKLTEQLSASQAELDVLRSNLEAVNATAVSAAEEHARLLAEAEKAHQARQDELTAEIGRISAELEAQEAVYSARVQTVKDEHDRLLQQAFERAKNEAGEAHGQDLQTLREQSEAAIEQLRSSHQTTVDGLKTDHEVELASRAQTYQKQLSSQSLELKATSEDLAKAKATLSISLQEVEALKAQLDETRQAVQTAANATAADRDADVARLTKEVSNARDELGTLNEGLRITQESMQEMGKNHQMELEEAAKGRAEEVSKLRAAHDAEIQSLVADKSTLVTKLSDLEGELLTARASAVPAEAIASPKRNGLSTAPVETVTKEELQHMHEAHNLKINDLQAQHDKAIRALQEQIAAAQVKASKAEEDLERKKMEIMYLEQEQEEGQDQITRLKEDVERLSAEKVSSNTE